MNPTSLFSFFLFQVGFAAAAPFVFKALSCPLAGITADLFRQNLFSTKTVRRMYYATGNSGLICISEEAPLKRVHTQLTECNCCDKFVIKNLTVVLWTSCS